MRRPPDLIVGGADNPYLMRWTLWRWRGWQLALHKICRSDDDRALHDHVGDNLSIILKGSYLEVRNEGTFRPKVPLVFRKAETPHRLIIDGEPVWTLWLRWPKRREWGFHCPQGWVNWKNFVTGTNTGVSGIGKGCS